MNIERGLLWNQENAVNRGIQVNQTFGKFTASAELERRLLFQSLFVALGFFGLCHGPHALAFVAGGNLGQTAFQTLATPVQNNGSIYNVIYTYSKGPGSFSPTSNTVMFRPTRRSAW